MFVGRTRDAPGMLFVEERLCYNGFGITYIVKWQRDGSLREENDEYLCGMSTSQLGQANKESVYQDLLLQGCWFLELSSMSLGSGSAFVIWRSRRKLQGPRSSMLDLHHYRYFHARSGSSRDCFRCAPYTASSI